MWASIQLCYLIFSSGIPMSWSSSFDSACLCQFLVSDLGYMKCTCSVMGMGYSLCGVMGMSHTTCSVMGMGYTLCSVMGMSHTIYVQCNENGLYYMQYNGNGPYYMLCNRMVFPFPSRGLGLVVAPQTMPFWLTWHPQTLKLAANIQCNYCMWCSTVVRAFLIHC